MDNKPGVKLGFIVALAIAAIWTLLTKDITYGLDLKGGSTLTYSLAIGDDDLKDPNKNVVEETMAIFRKRIDRIGLKEINLIPVGKNEIMVELPGMNEEEAESIKKILTELGVLEWRIVADATDLITAGIDIEAENQKRQALEEESAKLAEIGKRGPVYLGPEDKGIRWYYYSKESRSKEGLDGYYVFLDDSKSVGGDQLEDIYQDYDRNNLPGVGFSLKASGAGKMRTLTEQNLKKQMAIILNGEVHSAPVLEGVISDRGIIGGGSGGFTRQDIKDLIATLKSGSLEIKPQLESKNQIGPTLGAEAIQRGFTAILIGFGSVIVFMLAIYRMAGLVAIIALFLNLLFILGTLVFCEGTLTLPGIAGILLTVGMAVDASILIFERVREERGQCKNLADAFTNGFQRATVTILDANVTTFLTAVCLFYVGTGPIKGFATTLMIGIICTLLTGVFASRMIFSALLKYQLYKEYRAIQILSNPRIPFLKYSRIAFIGSMVTIVLGMAVFFSYEDKLDLDFSGGSLVQMNAKTPLTPETVRDRVHATYPDAEIYPIGSGKGGTYSRFEVRAKMLNDADQAAFAQSIASSFKEELFPPGMTVFGRNVADENGNLPENAKGMEGGFHFELNTQSPIERSLVETSLDDVGASSYHIAGGESGASDRYEVWTSNLGPTVDDTKLRIILKKELNKQGAALSDPFPKTAYISPKAVGELTRKAILAILASLILILLYVLFRFHDIRFGYGAVAALVHDVVLTMGLVALFDMLGLVDAKLNLPIIAAFLTIIGYSLNDTIVIFDRIRERTKKVGGNFRDIVNTSINETLSRTIFTSATTFVVVFALFALNKGQRSVVEGLAFALIIGIVTGTYSTIYVASSLLVFLRKPGEDDSAPAHEKKTERPTDKAIPAAHA